MQACTGDEFYKDESTENSSLLTQEKKINKSIISEIDSNKIVISDKIESKNY